MWEEPVRGRMCLVGGGKPKFFEGGKMPTKQWVESICGWQLGK